MKIAMDKLCIVFSRAFDIIEKEQLGASERHCMRTAALCAHMARRLGYDDDAVLAISICAMFHDNALTEYHLSLKDNPDREKNMLLHNVKGQNNVAWLPFSKSIDGYILYHHEKGNGKGPFKKREGEYPFEAGLIAAADAVDVSYHLQRVPTERLQALRDEVSARPDAFSTPSAIEVLMEVLDNDLLESLRDDAITSTLDRCIPRWEVGLNDPGIMYAGAFVSHVIDYKSAFTHKHTSQIANRAWLMAEHYGYPNEDKAALYLAASLHDIGKIATPIGILEKPGLLDNEEFKIIQNHVRYTRSLLDDVPHLGSIQNWAADHHEKLNGTGYPNAKTADSLDFNARLMACLDIYQAVSEPRPYHEARTHQETMSILNDMAEKDLIDARILKDLDDVMAEHSMKDIPSPVEYGDD
jgi:HD-GYP domain-containing protein (c-di-GMP phosphodiesterase class II)